MRCGWRCWFWLLVTLTAMFYSAAAWAQGDGRITGVSFEFVISTIVMIGGALITGYARGVDKSVSRVESQALVKAAELEKLTEKRASEVLEIHRMAITQVWNEFSQQQAQINLLRNSDSHPTRHETEQHREFVEEKLRSIESQARDGISRLEKRIDAIMPIHQHRRAEDMG